MSNIFVKTKGVDSWKEFLANTEIQWQPGYSAKSLAAVTPTKGILIADKK